MSKTRIAILISGRGSNMEAILRNVGDGCLSDCCEVGVVFSNVPEARGLAVAREFGVATACVSSVGRKRAAFEAEMVEVLSAHRPDFLVLAGFMRILSPIVLRAYRNRIINIHPADTARHQGLHGYEWAYENRLAVTKITVHLVDEGLDTGPVLDQKTVDLRDAGTLEDVERIGLAVEHGFYSQVLKKLFTGQIPVPRVDRG